MPEIVTMGETMAALVPQESGYLRYARGFAMRTAGAESNVAVGVCKLGHTAGWISRLGSDEFGEFILRELRGEGVDVSRVLRSEDRRTGVMFKQFTPGGETSVFYYRENSAASTLAPADIDEDYIRSARILHVSGVTPALSESCAEATRRCMEIARAAGVRVSFDPNIRLKLWSRDQARGALRPLLPLADIALLGEDEGEMLLGESEPKALIQALRDLGISSIAIKRGARGAIVADAEGLFEIPPVKTTVVDNIGAGDAFDAGFLCGLLEERGIRECGEMGARMGAYAVSAQGDVEGLPGRAEFDRQLDKTIYR